MRRRAMQSESNEDQINRFAWWVSFLVTLVVVGLLSIAHSAYAQPPQAEAPQNPFLNALFEEEEWEEDEEEWGSEAGEAELEEICWEEEDGEEFCEEEDEAAEEENAAECIVTQATARVAAKRKRHRLELTVRYRSERSAAVTIRWRLRGAKGKLNLGTEHARFSRSGTFRHLETGLDKKRMRKALAAREFRVEVRAVNTPARCKSELASHLSTRRSSAAGPFWFDRSQRRG